MFKPAHGGGVGKLFMTVQRDTVTLAALICNISCRNLAGHMTATLAPRQNYTQTFISALEYDRNGYLSIIIKLTSLNPSCAVHVLHVNPVAHVACLQRIANGDIMLFACNVRTIIM